MPAAPVMLLVEASPAVRLRLPKWLESVLTDPTVFTAETAHDALWLAEKEQPTHILVGIDLPDINGLEFLQQMRQSLPTARLIVTGWYDSRFFLDKIRLAGADGFVRKDKIISDLLQLWEISIE